MGGKHRNSWLSLSFLPLKGEKREMRWSMQWTSCWVVGEGRALSVGVQCQKCWKVVRIRVRGAMVRVLAGKKVGSEMLGFSARGAGNQGSSLSRVQW